MPFNLHKDPKNHYKEFLLLFKPFCETKSNLKKNFVSWNNAYITLKNDIKKTQIFKNIFSIKIMNVIMNGMLCNHNFKNTQKYMK